MSDAEDDYLSDKFLSQSVAAPSSKPLTYAERRRQAQREAEIKNEQNRKKSRRQLEEESIREGLGKSLFERAKEEEQSGMAQGNKAMSMMMKMGFKPGQSLGKVDELEPKADTSPEPTPERRESPAPFKSSGHLVEPLPLDVWSGRQGLGKRKRAVSPGVTEKLARVVKQAAEDEAHGSFRDRARQEYEERRAEGRLVSATQTCITLDEKAEKTFNVLWLNPQDPESFPPELLDSITSDIGAAEVIDLASTATENDRLRHQMQADSLQPLLPLDEVSPDSISPSKALPEVLKYFTPAAVEDARKFISMSAQSRLSRLLAYLREEYFYCFWCGTQYTDLQDLNNGCPGLDEEAHD